jgi:1,4-alpha-glucan branching enzyme
MATRTPSGHLLLTLHAHLPYVRHPEHPVFLEENWLFEALFESYLPLLMALERLAEEGAPARLSLSLTPTLSEMLDDAVLQERFVRHLRRLLELAEKEVQRLRHEPDYLRTAEMYRARFRSCLDYYEDRAGRKLIPRFRALRDAGVLEILTSAATHAILPLLATPGGLRAQIRAGRANYRRHFGTDPRGIWLPECAYAPGLDEELAAEGLRYSFLDSHGVLLGTPRPRYGTFAPAFTRSRVAVFARDIDSSKQVWSGLTGYPGDPLYREFYRDLGHDADYAYIHPYLATDGARHDTGLKYHRVTGGVPLHEKAPYDPGAAEQQARAHAEHFLHARRMQMERVGALLRRAPVVVAPYDAELFGHWWFEGPVFLESLLRGGANDPALDLTTPPAYLAEHPTHQVLEPSLSSWGDKGYIEVWLNGGNDWIYRHTHKAEERMLRLARRHADADGPVVEALDQAARELLLAQSSDWAFILTTQTASAYAARRVEEHVGRFNELHDMVESGRVDPDRLAAVRQAAPLFPELDFRIFLPEGPPASASRREPEAALDRAAGRGKI